MSMAGENMLNDQDLHRGLGKKKFKKFIKIQKKIKTNLLFLNFR